MAVFGCNVYRILVAALLPTPLTCISVRHVLMRIAHICLLPLYDYIQLHEMNFKTGTNVSFCPRVKRMDLNVETLVFHCAT